MGTSSRGDGSAMLAQARTPSEREWARRVARRLRRSVRFVREPREVLAGARNADVVLLFDSQEPGDLLSLVRRLHRSDRDRIIAVHAGKPESGVLKLYELGATVATNPGDDPTEMARAIEAAERGRAQIDGEVAWRLLHRYQDLSEVCVEEEIEFSRCERLSEREREVIALLGRHLSNRGIADALGISPGTVKTHVHNILEKLDVDRRELAGIYWRIFSGAEGCDPPPKPHEPPTAGG